MARKNQLATCNFTKRLFDFVSTLRHPEEVFLPVNRSLTPFYIYNYACKCLESE